MAFLRKPKTVSKNVEHRSHKSSYICSYLLSLVFGYHYLFHLLRSMLYFVAMRPFIFFILSFVATRAAPSIDLSQVDDLRRDLRESGRELQINGICTELLSVFPFDGCRCNINALQNNVQVVCSNYCNLCATTEDLCVAYSSTVQFSLVPPLQPQRAVIREVQTGQDSSKSTLVIETRYNSNQVLLSCSTSINNQQCSSCVINSSCADAIHDCRNVGLPGVVDSCNKNQLSALPSTNPFSTLANDELNFDQCSAPQNPAPVRAPVPAPVRAPVPTPVRAPVPTPTSSGIPPKKTIPTDKEKDQLKLSTFDANRGGLTRKLKSIRGK